MTRDTLKEPLIKQDDNTERRSSCFCKFTCFAIFTSLMFGSPFFFIYASRKLGVAKDDAAFASALVYVFVAVGISAHTIYQHISNWYIPNIQTYMVRIILMVPIFSILAWLSLKYDESTVYFEAVKEIYEAFTIFSFVRLVIALLGGQESMISILERKDPHYGEHKCCFRWCYRTWAMGDQFLRNCLRGTLQFVIVMCTNAILIFIYEPQGTYDNTTLGSDNIYTYMAIAQFVSTITAVYCLITLFHAIVDDLRQPKDWQPFYKFVCVKGVIFFTLVQGIVISVLVKVDVIGEIDSVGWDSDHVAEALQNYIICFQMCFFAVFHHFVYSYNDCLPSDGERPYNRCFAILNIFTPTCESCSIIGCCGL